MSNSQLAPMLLGILAIGSTVALPGCAPHSAGPAQAGPLTNGRPVALTLRARTETLVGHDWTAADLEATRAAVEARARLGASAISKVSASPPDGIIVEAAHMPDPAELNRLTTPNRLGFYFLPQLGSAPGHSNARWRIVKPASGDEMLVDAKTGSAVTGQEVDKAVFNKKADLSAEDFLPKFKVEIMPGGSPFIDFELRDEAGHRFEQVSARHINQHLGIFLDRKLISAPRLRSPFANRGAIEGNFTVEKAQDLANKLNGGALPVPLVLVLVRSQK